MSQAGRRLGRSLAGCSASAAQALTALLPVAHKLAGLRQAAAAGKQVGGVFVVNRVAVHHQRAATYQWAAAVPGLCLQRTVTVRAVDNSGLLKKPELKRPDSPPKKLFDDAAQPAAAQPAAAAPSTAQAAADPSTTG
jgi:hypothetical protein